MTKKRLFGAVALLGLTVMLSIVFIGCKQGVEPEEEKDTTPPAEVSALQAVVGNAQVSLSWTNPNDTDLYQVEITANPAEGTLKNPVYLNAKTGQSGSFTVEGLVNAKEYSFTVKTIDKSLNKSSGISEKATPEKTEIEIVTNYNDATQTWTKQAINITISFQSVGGSSLTPQVLKWAEGSKSYKFFETGGSDITSNTLSVTKNGTYTVYAEDTVGRFAIKEITVSKIDKTAPNKPSNFEAEYSFTAKKIVLSWNNPVDIGSGLDKTIIEYSIDGTAQSPVEVEASKNSYKLLNIEPNGKKYTFTIKALDKVGNTSQKTEEKLVIPSTTAVVSEIILSRNNMDTEDPNRKITVTLNGSRLDTASALKVIFNGKAPVTCTNITETSATVEITDIPKATGEYFVKALLKATATDSLKPVLEKTFKVMELAKITEITVEKDGGNDFETDADGNLKIAENTGGKMKVELTGKNFDVEGTKLAVKFNGATAEAEIKNAETAEIELDIPVTEGTYPIKALLKKNYQPTYSEKDTIILRVTGAPKLTSINLPVYNDALQGQTVEIGIYGENFDTVQASDFTVAGTAGGTNVNIEIKNAFVAILEYQMPYEAVVTKTVDVTLNSVTKSAEFTGEIDKFTDMQVVIPSGEEVTVAYDSQDPWDYKDNLQLGKWQIYADGVLQEKSVTIKPYSIGRTEVSYKLWKEVYDWATGVAGGAGQPSKKYYFENKGERGEIKGGSSAIIDKNHPVTHVPWRDCIIWCNAYTEKTKGADACVYRDSDGNILRASWKEVENLIDKSKMEGKKGYRLPTEAEWEFAARGGCAYAKDWKYKYAGGDEIDEVAWYENNSEDKTHPCGKKKANRLSLYDMSGNVSEWNWGLYDSSGDDGVRRGWHWYAGAVFDGYAVIARDRGDLDYQHEYGLGFRLACSE